MKRHAALIRLTLIVRSKPRDRAIVTTTNMGADGRLIGALPRLELIANAGGRHDFFRPIGRQGTVVSAHGWSAKK